MFCGLFSGTPSPNVLAQSNRTSCPRLRRLLRLTFFLCLSWLIRQTLLPLLTYLNRLKRLQYRIRQEKLSNCKRLMSLQTLPSLPGLSPLFLIFTSSKLSFPTPSVASLRLLHFSRLLRRIYSPLHPHQRRCMHRLKKEWVTLVISLLKLLTSLKYSGSCTPNTVLAIQVIFHACNGHNGHGRTIVGEIQASHLIVSLNADILATLHANTFLFKSIEYREEASYIHGKLFWSWIPLGRQRWRVRLCTVSQEMLIRKQFQKLWTGHHYR